jgi:hypothetical protein
MSGIYYRNKKFKILLLLAVSIFSANTGQAKKTQTPPPNIIVIMTDDLGYGDTGCYGASRVKTPNIDRLASEGLRFTNAYAPASTCTPTRYSLMTGEYAWRKKVGILPGDAAMTVNPQSLTLPGLMKRNGYVTACVGKWHLGWAREMSISTIKSLPDCAMWGSITRLLFQPPTTASLACMSKTMK